MDRSATTTEAPVLKLRFSTEQLAPHQRIPVWREVFGRAMARLDFAPPPDGHLIAQAELQSFQGFSLVSMASTELRYQKPANLINSDDLILTIVDSGFWSGSQLGREVQLQAGDAVLCANGEVAAGAVLGRRIMFRIPRDVAEPMVPDVMAMASRPIRRQQRALPLLRHYLRGLRDGSMLGTAELQRLAIAHVYDLLALTLGGTRDAAKLAQGRGLRAARLHAVKDDVARNLTGGDVSVGAVAARHQVTPRYVQMLFEHDGTTFAEHVLAVRLAHVHRLLSDPRRAADKAASVAFDAGFGDLSHFYRAFRRRYGLSPSDVRAQSRSTN
jgi:AraC-like DNA-binding protein